MSPLGPEPSVIRLVCGLGNPGPDYERTRHNVGFLVLDHLAAAWGCAWERSARWGALWARHDRALLVKPSTFMNRSGEPLRALANFYKIEPGESLVVLDDTALPLGRLRLRPGGSAGGHNGLESILLHFGDTPRVRLGIGTPPPEGSVDYVLGRFFEDETPAVQEMVGRAAEAVNCAIDKGLSSAMNTFNQAT